MATDQETIDPQNTGFEFSMDESSFDGDDENLLSGLGDLDVEGPPSAPLQSQRKSAETAYYTASLNHGVDGGEALINEFVQVKNELLNTGESQTVSSLMTLLDEENKTEEAKAIYGILANPENSMELKKIVLSEYLANAESPADLKEAFSFQLFDERPENTEQQILEKKADFEWFNQRSAALEQISVMANKQIAQGDVGIWRGVEGFLELVVPFLEGYSVEQARDAALGDKNDWAATMFRVVFSGEGIVQLREALSRMPPEKRVEATKKMLDAIGDLPGQDMKKMFIIQDVIEDYETWQRGLSDFVGVLDATFIGSPVIKMLKAAKRVPKVVEGVPTIHPESPLGVAKLADPQVAKAMAAAAVVDQSGEVALAMGVPRSVIVADAMWPVAHVNNRVADGMASTIDLVEEITQKGAHIFEETAGQSLNVSGEAKDAVKNRMNQELEAVEGMVLHGPQSIVIDDGVRYAGVAVYGRTPDKGYANRMAMQKEIKRLKAMGLEGNDLYIMAKDMATGTIVRQSEFPGMKSNEFFIGRRFNHVYNKDDAVMWGADAVSNWPLARTAAGSYFYDIASRFEAPIADALLRAKDLGTAIETQLLDSVREGMKGATRWFGFSTAGHLRVFDALRKGAEQKTLFSPRDLAGPAHQLSEGEQKAYYAFRKVSDVLWSLTNRGYYRKLKSENMSEVRVAGKTDTWFARPIETPLGVTNKYAYDTTTGQIRRLSDPEILELYKNGGHVGKTRGLIHGADGHQVGQIIVDGTNATLHAIPNNPLPYIDGYVQRSYKENYFLRQVPKVAVVDGVAHRGNIKSRKRFGTVVAGFPNTRTAEEARVKWTSENPDFDYVWDIAKELDVDPMIQDYQLYERSLRSTRKRGSHLAGNFDAGLATIEDPVESLMRTVRAVSNHVAMTDVVESMKNSWKLTYGHMTKGGEFPKTIGDIDRSVALADEHGAAVAVKQLIDTVNNTPSYTEKAWQRFMVGMGEWLEGIPGLRNVGDFSRYLGKSSPIAAVRKLPSHFYIALRPLRQVLVQSGQLMQYTFLEPKYIASGQGAREMVGLMFAAMSRGRSYEKRGMDIAAKTFGGTRAEFDTVVKTYFDRSGLPYSVDANWLVEGTVNKMHEDLLRSPLKRFGRVPLDTYNYLVGWGKKYGFDVGEFTNLTGSWLIAKRRWQRANPEQAAKWSEQQFADVIAADARKISYAMTQPGTLAYQKGALSIPLQFMAVPHKALLSMTANKYWSRADKGKMFMANMTLFGGYGLGLNSIIDSAQEEFGLGLDESSLQKLKGGLVDWGFNKAAALAFDEKGQDPTKIMLSKSFSPIGDGVFPGHDIFASLLDGEFAKVILGPSLGLVDLQEGRLARAVQDVVAVTNQQDITGFDAAMKYLTIGAQVASGYSDYTKWRYSVKHGQIVSARGKELGIEPTATEALAQLFGFAIYETDNQYELLRRFGDEEKEVQKMYDQYYESLMRIYTVHGDIDPDMARERALRESSLLGHFTPEELIGLTVYIQKKDRFNATTLGDSLMRKIARYTDMGGDAQKRMRNAIEGAVGIDTDTKNKWLKYLSDEGVL